MNNEKAFQIGQYAAYQGKSREVPEYMTGESIRAWLDGFDSIRPA
ncbi:hypothetical protein [Brucella intermedia]|nr:hypothetical protein [Brucella intermedia]WGJ07477.1 hypothetical protein QBQ48_04250 [Brucella intermedia]